MKLGFGRVVAAQDADEVVTPARGAVRTGPRLGRVVPAEAVAAADQARGVVERAEAEASKLLETARADAQSLRLRAVEEARAEAVAALAARELAFAAREREIDARQLDRLVNLARLLAERLLGETLAVNPARVVSLARQALTEAQGARRVNIAAHPDDVPVLEAALGGNGLGPAARVVADATRARGSLRFDTDIGTLDAALAPQLERLAKKLRAALAHD